MSERDDNKNQQNTGESVDTSAVDATDASGLTASGITGSVPPPPQTLTLNSEAVRDLKVNDKAGVAVEELVTTKGGTAHLTLPGIGQDRSHIDGVVIDKNRVEASMRERAARLHPNPPDDMPVVTRIGESGAVQVTVKELRNENTGEGQRDARRVMLVDETRDDHPAKPNALSGATVYASTSLDESVTGDDVPHAATGEEDERARLAADFASDAPTPVLQDARKLQEDVTGVKGSDFIGEASGGAPTPITNVDQQKPPGGEGGGTTHGNQAGGNPNSATGSGSGSTGTASSGGSNSARTSSRTQKTGEASGSAGGGSTSETKT